MELKAHRLRAFNAAMAQSQTLNSGRRLCDELTLNAMLEKSPRNVVVIYLANDRANCDRKADGDFGFFLKSMSEASIKSKSDGDNASFEIYQRVAKALQADDIAFQKSVEKDLLAFRKLAGKSSFISLIAISNSFNETTWGAKNPDQIHQSFLYAKHWQSPADYSLIQIKYKLFIPNGNGNHPLSYRMCILDSLSRSIASQVAAAKGQGKWDQPTFVIISRDRGTSNYAFAPFSLHKLTEIVSPNQLQVIAKESCEAEPNDDPRLVQEVQTQYRWMRSKKAPSLAT